MSSGASTFTKASLVTFDPCNGEPASEQMTIIGTQIEEPDAPSKKGCSFEGWTVDGSIASFPYTMPGNKVVFKASWKTDLCTATFVDPDGTVYTTISFEPGATIKLPNGRDGSISKPGMTLVGWSAGTSASYGLGSGFSSETDIVFEAIWIEGTDVIVYDADGGTLDGKLYERLDGGVASLSDAASKDGCEFLGWIMVADDGGEVVCAPGLTVQAAGPVYATAYFVEDGTKVSTVSYDPGQGSGSISVQKAEPGKRIMLPTALDMHRDGCTFDGWALSAGGSAVGRYFSIGSEDTELHAIWTSDSPDRGCDDDDDDPVPSVVPGNGSGSGKSGGTDREVLVLIAAAAAAAVLQVLLLADLRRR